MIPFWHHRHIAELLRTRQLTEKQRAGFLIGGSALQFAVPHRGLFASGQSILAFTLVLTYLGITVWGLKGAFQTNQTGDGQAFIERVTVLGLPLGLQMWAQSLALYLIAWFVGPTVMQATGLRVLYLLVSVGIYVWFFLRLRRYMALVSDAGVAST